MISNCYIYNDLSAGSSTAMRKAFGGFYGVLISKLARIRSTLNAMDSNTRIDSKYSKKYKEHIALKLSNLSSCCKVALATIGLYIVSRYKFERGYESNFPNSELAKGDISLRAEMVTLIQKIKLLIAEYVDTVEEEILSSNSVRLQDDETSGHPNPSSILTAGLLNVNSEELNDRPSISPPDSKTEEGNVPIPDKYRHIRYRHVHEKMGDIMLAFYKSHPMRTFGAMMVQCSVQICSSLQETVIFIDSTARYGNDGGISGAINGTRMMEPGNDISVENSNVAQADVEQGVQLASLGETRAVDSDRNTKEPLSGVVVSSEPSVLIPNSSVNC